MTAECDCGFEAKNGAGLAAHQRHCDYDEGEEDPSLDYSHPTTVSTAVAESVAERDSYECVRCESTDSLTIHRYDEDGADIPQNLVLLCGDCDALISGGDKLTKRTQVGR